MKCRTSAVNAAVPIITIDVIDFPIPFMTIISQHRFLVLYALTVVGFQLVFVFNG